MITQKTVNAISAMNLLSKPLQLAAAASGLRETLRAAQMRPAYAEAWSARPPRFYN